MLLEKRLRPFNIRGVLLGPLNSWAKMLHPLKFKTKRIAS